MSCCVISQTLTVFQSPNLVYVILLRQPGLRRIESLQGQSHRTRSGLHLGCCKSKRKVNRLCTGTGVWWRTWAVTDLWVQKVRVIDYGTVLIGRLISAQQLKSDYLHLPVPVQLDIWHAWQELLVAKFSKLMISGGIRGLELIVGSLGYGRMALYSLQVPVLGSLLFNCNLLQLHVTGPK